MPLIRAEFLRPHQLGRTVLIHDPSQVLYLPFDHDDGSKARDRSGYNNHGVVYGATRVAGKIGSALSFDGTNDYVEIDDSMSLNITSSFTICAWIKPNTLSGAHHIFSKRPYGVGGYWLRQIDAGLQVTIEDPPNRYENGPTNVLSLNEWQYVIGLFDHASNLVKIYVNGVEKFSDSTTYAPESSSGYKAYVGSIDTIYNVFSGIIDEVRIYNRALSQAEIRRVMNLRGI